MSPILVRPVREQLEHDRIIRMLQTKYKRKYEVGINPGNERSAPAGTGPLALFPDLVLYSPERGRKLLGVVEVETTESVNNLEAMSEWVPLGRLRVPFQLYVPVGMVDVARRLSQDYDIPLELFSFSGFGDQIVTTSVYRSPNLVEPRLAAARPSPPAKPTSKPPARTPRVATSTKTVRVVKSARPARTAKGSAPTRREASRVSKAALGRSRAKAAKTSSARKTHNRK